MANLAELWGETTTAPAPVRAAGFPVVAPNVQQTRNVDRQKILAFEYYKNVDDLAKATTPRDRTLYQSNIDSLIKEIGGVPRAPATPLIPVQSSTQPAIPTTTPAKNTLADLWESTPATLKAAPSAAPTGKSETQQLAEAQKPATVNPNVAAYGVKKRADVKENLPIQSVGELARALLQNVVVAPVAAGAGIVGGLIHTARTGEAPGQVGAQIQQAVTEQYGYTPPSKGGQEMLKAVTEIPAKVFGSEMPLPPFTGSGPGTVLAPAAIKQVAPTVVKVAQTPVPGVSKVADFVAEVKSARQQMADQFAQKKAIAPTAVPETGLVSAGAAATSNETIISQALSVATPELRESVKNIPVNKVNVPTLQRHIEADSLPVPVRLTEGQATGDIVKLSNEQNLRGKNTELANRFNEQNGQLVENLGLIRDKAAPDVYGTKKIENSQGIIDAYKEIDKNLNNGINADYQALRDAAGGQFPVDAVQLLKNVETKLKKELLSNEAPAGQLKELQRLAESNSMTFEDYLSGRRNLGDIARTHPDGSVRKAASYMIEEFEKLPLKAEAAAQKPLADKARASAKARFQMLEKDPAMKAAVDDSIPADKFIDKFVVNGVNKNINTMVQNLGKDSPAHQHMAAGTVNWLKDKAGIVDGKGNFSQAEYNRALKKLDDVNNLQEIFNQESASQLKTLGNVARYTQAQPRGAFVNNSNTLVGALAERAKQLTGVVVEKGLNVAVPGVQLGTSLMEMRARRASAAESKRALEVGAGTKLKDIGK
jgi:hypothetical protein